MTFAGYNAGRGRVRDWIKLRGDPRDPDVDAVDWVERIPFSETRNYVQRVIENLLVYRVRFGTGTLGAGDGASSRIERQPGAGIEHAQRKPARRLQRCAAATASAAAPRSGAVTNRFGYCRNRQVLRGERGQPCRQI